MKAVTGRDPAEDDFGPDLMRLMTAVRTHIADEEGSVFPQLAAACTPEQMRRMGAAVTAAERSAPTRSHQHAPHRPPVNAISEPALSLVDKVRDRIAGRGSIGGPDRELS